MFEQYIERTDLGLAAINGQLATNDYLRSIVQGRKVCAEGRECAGLGDLRARFPDDTQWKILDHCAAFTRLYAIYEQFVHGLVENLLLFFEANYDYQALPKCLKDANQAGIARIIDKIGGPRYADISLENLVENYSRALMNRSYKLEPKTILIHDQNLRLSELEVLFARCNLANVARWLSKHRFLGDFFASDRNNSTVEAQLRAMIQYRNDAAHGGIDVDDILSSSLIGEYVQFTKALCAALAEMVRRQIILNKIELGRCAVVGTVTEIFRGGKIGIFNLNGYIRKNQSVYVIEGNCCRKDSFLNIQLNSVNLDQIGSLFEMEVGVEFEEPVKLKAKIVAIE